MLHLHDIPYLLFDRDESFSSRAQGYALTIQQGIQTFDDFHLKLDSCSGYLSLAENSSERAMYCTSHSHVSLAADGRVLGVYGPPRDPPSVSSPLIAGTAGREVIKEGTSEASVPATMRAGANRAKERRKELNLIIHSAN